MMQGFNNFQNNTPSRNNNPIWDDSNSYKNNGNSSNDRSLYYRRNQMNRNSRSNINDFNNQNMNDFNNQNMNDFNDQSLNDFQNEGMNDQQLISYPVFKNNSNQYSNVRPVKDDDNYNSRFYNSFYGGGNNQNDDCRPFDDPFDSFDNQPMSRNRPMRPSFRRRDSFPDDNMDYNDDGRPSMFNNMNPLMPQRPMHNQQRFNRKTKRLQNAAGPIQMNKNSNVKSGPMQNKAKVVPPKPLMKPFKQPLEPIIKYVDGSFVKKNSNQKSLNSMVNELEEDKQVKEGKAIIKCTRCSMKFPTLDAFKDHLKKQSAHFTKLEKEVRSHLQKTIEAFQELMFLRNNSSDKKEYNTCNLCAISNRNPYRHKWSIMHQVNSYFNNSKVDHAPEISIKDLMQVEAINSQDLHKHKRKDNINIKVEKDGNSAVVKVETEIVDSKTAIQEDAANKSEGHEKMDSNPEVASGEENVAGVDTKPGEAASVETKPEDAASVLSNPQEQIPFFTDKVGEA